MIRINNPIYFCICNTWKANMGKRARYVGLVCSKKRTKKKKLRCLKPVIWIPLLINDRQLTDNHWFLRYHGGPPFIIIAVGNSFNFEVCIYSLFFFFFIVYDDTFNQSIFPFFFYITASTALVCEWGRETVLPQRCSYIASRTHRL